MASGEDEGFEEFRKYKKFGFKLVFEMVFRQEFPSDCEHPLNEIVATIWARMTEEERHPFNHEARLKREKVEHGGSNMAPLTPAPEPPKQPVNPADDDW